MNKKQYVKFEIAKIKGKSIKKVAEYAEEIKIKKDSNK